MLNATAALKILMFSTYLDCRRTQIQQMWKCWWERRMQPMIKTLQIIPVKRRPLFLNVHMYVSILHTTSGTYLRSFFPWYAYLCTYVDDSQWYPFQLNKGREKMACYKYVAISQPMLILNRQKSQRNNIFSLCTFTSRHYGPFMKT